MSSVLYGYIRHYGFIYVLKVIWCACSGVLFWRTHSHYKNGLEYVYLNQILGDTLCFARAAASVLNLNCAIILLPMCHTLALNVNQVFRKLHLPWTWLRWDAKSMHIFVGYIIFIFSAVHISSHTVNIWKFYMGRNYRHIGVHPYPNDNQVIQKLVFTTLNGITGILMFVVLLVLFLTTFPFVRRRFYNVFWYSHRLFIIFFILLAAHGFCGPLRKQINVCRHFPGCNFTSVTDKDVDFPGKDTSDTQANNTCLETPQFDRIASETWKWLIVPVVIYFCDVLFRVIRRSRKVEPTSMQLIANDMIEITFQVKHFHAQPSQYVLLNCRSLSTIEWHPFTIVQIPTRANDNQLKLLIKRSGDWTERLHQLRNGIHIDGVSNQEHNRYPTFYIDGPYSSPMEKMRDFKVVLCIAGGVGITPFLSQITYLLHSRKLRKDQKTIHMHLVFAARDEKLLQYCMDQTNDTVKQCLKFMGIDLVVELYITGNQNISLQATVGRPNFSDIFSRLSAFRRPTIGTFVCGPASLCQDVKQNSVKSSSRNTIFVFHKETF